MLFHIFIAISLWMKRQDGLPHNKQLVPSIAYASVIVLDTFILLFTGTRGAIRGSMPLCLKNEGGSIWLRRVA
jgi:hypothetical protein